MIHDIRGTNGSGKSTCVHNLLEKHNAEILKDEWNDECGLHVPDLNLRIAGTYENQCGGCDKLMSQNNVRYIDWLMEEWLKEHDGPIIMEGIIIAHTFQRWNDFSVRNNDCTIFYFLDTPLETCIERVRQRRRDSGKDGDNFDPRNVIKDFHSIAKVRKKMLDAGRKVIDVPHESAPQFIEEAIRDD